MAMIEKSRSRMSRNRSLIVLCADWRRKSRTTTPRIRVRRGFSMVEALLAVTITTIAGGALLTSIGSAVQTSSESTHTTIAQGLAEQLMDEIAATRFPEDEPIGSTVALTREDFEDIDDYSGWKQSPPTSRDGFVVGTEGFEWREFKIRRVTMMRLNPKYIAPFSRQVDIERVEPDSGSGWNVVSQHTNHRQVTVRVNYAYPNGTIATLAEVTRIFSYVPAAP